MKNVASFLCNAAAAAEDGAGGRERERKASVRVIPLSFHSFSSLLSRQRRKEKRRQSACEKDERRGKTAEEGASSGAAAEGKRGKCR